MAGTQETGVLKTYELQQKMTLQLKLMLGHLLLLLYPYSTHYIPRIRELLYSTCYLESVQSESVKRIFAIRRITYQLFTLSISILHDERIKISMLPQPSFREMARLNLIVKQLGLLTQQIRIIAPLSHYSLLR